ncbi:MAG: hypothetical protein Ta2E_03280 [Mycoplasmoidaceae bacterium]|nr:MAG: hypothetical protein Ta2E_03280 [Mycoplasmoidaceae bacterium]
MKLRKKIGLKMLLNVLAIFGVGIIAFSVTSCGTGVDAKVIDNMVQKGNGADFGGGLTMENLIKQALTDDAASTDLKRNVTNKILYQWYYNNKESNTLRDRQQFKDNWDKWVDDAKYSYDEAVKSAKSSNSNNWKFYFQQQTLDPIAADGKQKNPVTGDTESPKDTYIRDFLTSNIRQEFEKKVFDTNYFGMKKQTAGSTVTNYSLNSEVMAPISNTTDMDSKLLAHPELWQTIDFYPKAKKSYNPAIDLDWQYAYFQHIAFLEYTLSAKPVVASMVLWKGADDEGKFKQIYNVTDDTTNSNGRVPADAKLNYKFPIFNNTKFSNYIKDGFGGATPSYFFENNESGISPQGTKLVNIPTGGSRSAYGDDAATLIKVNLGTDVFTTLDVTFGATVSDLWQSKDNAISSASGINNIQIPLYNQANILPSENNILKNFLFTDTIAPTASNANPLPTEFKPVAQVLGKTYDQSGVVTGQTYAAAGGQLDQKITVGTDNKVHAELFNHSSDYYKEGYTDIVSAFQLSEKSSTTPLPYVLIRERSGGDDATGGVHMIGLDGTGYLSKASSTGFNTTALNSDPWSQLRENDILKYRALTSEWGDTRYATGFNFTDTDVKTYFNNNFETLVLQVASKMNGITRDGLDLQADYDSAVTTGMGKDIFELPSQHTSALWASLFAITQKIDAIGIYKTVIKNIDESYGKLKAFNSTESANLHSQGEGAPSAAVNNQTIYHTYDVYKNGLTSRFSFSAYTDTSANYKEALNRTIFPEQLTLLAPIQNLDNPFVTDIYDADAIDISDLYDDLIDGVDVSNFIAKINDSIVAKPTSKSDLAFYSEYIYTRMEEANVLINNFANTTNLPGSIFINAYKSYLTNGFNFLDANGKYSDQTTIDSSNNFSFPELQQVLASNYYISGVESYDKLSDFDIDVATAFATTDNLADITFKRWKAEKERDAGWGYSTSDGYSTKKLDYFKTIASIKYLLTKESNQTFNPKNFIDFQISKMSYARKYNFLWRTGDSIDYQDNALNGNDFGTVTPYVGATPANTNALNLYKFKQNFNDIHESRLTGVNTGLTSEDTANASFVETSENMKFAKTSAGDSLVGYRGMNEGSTGLTNFQGSALNDKFIAANPYKGPQTDSNAFRGSLYHLTAIGPYIDIKNNKYYTNPANPGSGTDITMTVRNADWFKNTITGYIYNNRTNSSNIATMTTTIGNSIPNFSEIKSEVESNYDIYTGSIGSSYSQDRQAQGFITSITDPLYYSAGLDPYDPTCSNTNFADLHFEWNGADSPLCNQFFTGINGADGPRELINPDNSGSGLASTLFYEETGSTNNTSRVMFEQIRNTDFYYFNSATNEYSKPSTDAEYADVWNHLISTFKESLIYNMIYSASVDYSIAAQSEALVRKISTANGKLVVYDRRLNDGLGYNWVKNYKEKN